MYRAPRPPQSVPERSESVPERSGAIDPDPRLALGDPPGPSKKHSGMRTGPEVVERSGGHVLKESRRRMPGSPELRCLGCRARPKRCFSFRFRFVFRFDLPVFLRRSAQTKNKNEARNHAKQRLGRALGSARTAGRPPSAPGRRKRWTRAAPRGTARISVRRLSGLSPPQAGLGAPRPAGARGGGARRGDMGGAPAREEDSETALFLQVWKVPGWLGIERAATSVGLTGRSEPLSGR